MWRFFFIFVQMDNTGLDKESAINTALANIKAGMSKPEIVSILSKLCPSVSKKTITRYYAAALDKCQEYKVKLHEAIESDEVEIIGRATSVMGVLSRLDRQKILTEIAVGRVTYQKEVATKFGIETLTVYPSWSDRKAAIQELNKMDSAYLPAEPDDDSEIREITVKRIGNGA